ncbi:MAG: RNA polymerase sigma factor, partial [Planctomycetota bacterium]
MTARAQERELLDRCISGHSGAWKELVDRYGALVAHAVRSTFLRVLKQADPSLVDDTVQAVWLSLCADGCRRLRQFESKASLSTWLTVLSTRKALDALRTERRKGSLRRVRLDDEDRDLLREIEAPEPAPGACLEEALWLRDAVEHLPDEDRLVLKMYYFDGLSYRSIAAALGLEVEAVASVLVR